MKESAANGPAERSAELPQPKKGGSAFFGIRALAHSLETTINPYQSDPLFRPRQLNASTKGCAIAMARFTSWRRAPGPGPGQRTVRARVRLPRTRTLEKGNGFANEARTKRGQFWKSFLGFLSSLRWPFLAEKTETIMKPIRSLIIIIISPTLSTGAGLLSTSLVGVPQFPRSLCWRCRPWTSCLPLSPGLNQRE